MRSILKLTLLQIHWSSLLWHTKHITEGLSAPVFREKGPWQYILIINHPDSFKATSD